MFWIRCLQLLQPDIAIGGTIAKISIDLLRQRGIQGLILDVDDTLVARTSRTLPPEVLLWITEVRGEFPIWLVSNNTSRNRIRAIAEKLDLPYICRAGKPSRRSLRIAMTAMQLLPTQVALVGDRLLTDILAGNRLGVLTILVDPVSPKLLFFRW